MSPVVTIIEKEKELYIKIYYPNKDTIDSNQVVFVIPKQEFTKICRLKRKAFYMKIII